MILRMWKMKTTHQLNDLTKALDHLGIKVDGDKSQPTEGINHLE